MERTRTELNLTLDRFAELPPDPRAMEQVVHLMMAGVDGAPAPAMSGAGVLSPADASGERLFRLLTLLFGLLALTAGLTWQFWIPWLLLHKALLIGLILVGSVSLITPLLLLPALKEEGACVREGGSVIC